MPDAYDRRARLAPVYIVAFPMLPLAATSVAALPGWYKLVSLCWFAIPYLVEEFARDRGKRLQADLWKSWGGGRAVHHLRWRSCPNSRVIAARHQDVETLLADGTKLPTATAEEADPGDADDQYEVAVGKLLVLAQENEPVLLTENARYGLRRNLWGLRPVGLVICAIGVVMCAGFLTLGAPSTRTAFGVVMGANLVLLAFWWRVVTPEWVKRQADNYSMELYKATRRKAYRTKPGEGTNEPNREEEQS